jgi:predicted nucleotidyltransferase
MILAENQIAELVGLLRQDLHPEAIYLFGSQADGSAQVKDSDVDLCLIVRDEAEPYRQTVQAYHALRKLPFPKDIIVRRSSRFHQRANWQSTLENEVKETGRLIYQA